MNPLNLNYISASTSSLNYGSQFMEDDLKFYTDGLISRNFPFGKSEKDYIKFEVFDIDNVRITGSMFYSSGSYVPYTKSFYDVFNQYNEYSYSEYQGDFVILGTQTQSLFFDVSKHLNALNIQDGNYTIYLELGRNLVGNEKSKDQKLMIDTVSALGDEVALIPKTLSGSLDEINSDYNVFSRSNIKIKEISNDLVYGLSNPEIYNIYNNGLIQNPTGSAEFKFNYSFKTDVEAICFLIDIYYGVKKGNYRANGQIATQDILGIYDQFKNWLYQNYESEYSFKDVRDYYYSLFVYIVNQELNRIRNTKPDSYPQIVEFLQSIFYDSIFFPYIYVIELKHGIDFTEYFKCYLNLSSGEKIPIINKKVIRSDNPTLHNKLALKLAISIPNTTAIGDDAWITCDFGFLPIVQKLYYFTKQVINTIPLRGPNFLIKLENSGNSTEALSMDELLGESGSLYNELASKIKAKNQQIIDTTDYRNFENFVNFSSADLRLQAFASKRSQIDSLYLQIKEIDDKLNLNPSDSFYIKEKTDANSQINALESGMDGYERFLYNNPAWYDEHNRVYDGQSSASFYDRNNGGSLINNIPQFMLEDSSKNEDYIKFVGMIGHFFDNISLAAKQYTEKNNYSSSPNLGISTDIVGDMLHSLGWDTEISKENLPLILSSFSKGDFDVGSSFYEQARNLSEEQRNQIIWKRILNSLPLIYKTKGTETSLNALISCFGVPKNIIKLKEYGGIQDVSDLSDKSLYVVEDVKYEPYFSGSWEYFALDWTGSAKTVELSFRFDTDKTHEQGKIFRLVNASDNWVLGVVREKGNDWGTLFFSIDNGSGNVQTVMSSRAPVFDGNSYHIMLRRNDVYELFNATASINDYPTRYDLCLQKSEDDRITYYSTASIFLSGSFNESFESGSYLFVGNYNQNTSSLNFDPEAFFGNIDDIRVWETPLSDKRFEAHTLHRNAYDLETPEQMVSDNLYRISFERPVNLYDDSSELVLNNLSFRKDFPTFSAINFPQVIGPLEQKTFCDPGTGPVFPYQFARYDVRMTMKLPDYGSNKFRSNKINYVQQELYTNLSSDTRSSYMMSELENVDSNRIGIFFSPSEIQNTEIIKFLGDFPLGDLIGDPADVYKSSYEKFEQFREIYYDQGFGNIDFTFFMNIIRFYFDKAMFKYIRGVIPARASLVDGILIEPSILERPKLEFKPLVNENIAQKNGDINEFKGIYAVKDPEKSASLQIKYRGTSTCTDVNQVMFPAEQDDYGFKVFADNGLAFYKEKYYRADVLKYQRKYQITQRYLDPFSQLTENQIVNDFRGTTETISQSYYKVNMAELPGVNKYPMTSSFIIGTYFSGSLYFDAGLRGWQDYTTTSSHGIVGLMSGSVVGLNVNLTNPTASGFIFNKGLGVSGSFIDTGKSVRYFGYFDVDNGVQSFEGNIYTSVAGNSSLPSSYGAYNIYFTTGNPTSSIFDAFRTNAYGVLFGPLVQGLDYRKKYSMEYYPANASLLNGYMDHHYKNTKRQFSQREFNGYQTNPATKVQSSFKWIKGSQNKKTTVDPQTGLLDNSDPIETKTI